MTKYRIVKLPHSPPMSGKKYRVEKKFLFFWFTANYSDFYGGSFDWDFKSIEEAKEFIDEMIAISERKKKAKQQADDYKPIYYP